MVGPSALRVPSAAERGKSYYRILGLPECTPIDGVKRKYKELALKLHPDKNLNDPLAGERFQVLNTAYETLSNPEKKKLVDDALVMSEATLAPPDSLQTAATLFKKQQSAYHEELNAFRMRRRASSQSTRAAGAASSSSADKPSQYTKEQTDFFRQREKEREREMSKRVEREKEQQRETELEKYRVAQEERLRDEERRARDARLKLDKAEAALLAATARAFNNIAGTSPVDSTGGSFRGLNRRDGHATSSSHRSASCDAAAAGSPVASNMGKMSSPSTPRPTAGGSGSSATMLSTPRNNFMKSSQQRSSSLSRIVHSPEFLSSLGGATEPSSSSGGVAGGTSSSTAFHNVASPLEGSFNAAATPLSAKLKRERERQDENRRSEQERYLQKKLGEIRNREALRSRHAVDEEFKLYQRELQLLEDNERGERTQFLEQEEELERRMFIASFRRVEHSLSAKQRLEPLQRNESAVRKSVEALEHGARQCLIVARRSTVVRHGIVEQEAAERATLLGMWAIAQERARNTIDELRRNMRLEDSLRQKSESQAIFGAKTLHLTMLLEPSHRSLLVHQFLKQHTSMMATCSAMHTSLVAVFAARRQTEQDERLSRVLLAMTANETIRRRIVQETEVDGFLHVQRSKGQHLQHMMQAQAREHHNEVELMRMRHDAEVTKLLEELSRLHQQLADARLTTQASSPPHAAAATSTASSNNVTPKGKQHHGGKQHHIAVGQSSNPLESIPTHGPHSHVAQHNQNTLSPPQPSFSQQLLYPPEIPLSHISPASSSDPLPRFGKPTIASHHERPDAFQHPSPSPTTSPLQRSFVLSPYSTPPSVLYNIPPPTTSSAAPSTTTALSATSSSSGGTPLGALYSTPLLRSKQWGGNASAAVNAKGSTPPPGIRRPAGTAAEL
ncbi:DNA-J chaperone, putative [Bodo saltans]|uniref:DNA-J chaperone, putative n=1 Tax=Bodo saltans TaxID=75058 RepID=A0A0S4JTB4_BODSA|nr:DNA-J chaperone, putative [Bodo saltans]|eukprot:CUG91818.1 DNA-J chaperone, putative [Bodo saltans]